jgi:hypothetical protein
LPSSKARLKRGAFPPPELPGLDGTTPLSDSRPGRHPAMTSRSDPRPPRVSPDDPSLSSDVPCPIPRRIDQVHLSITSLLVLPSPSPWRVGIRIVPFEACSGFTRVTARRIAQPPQAAFVTRLRPPSYPEDPLVSYRTNRQLSGWNLPPLEIRAYRAHTVTRNCRVEEGRGGLGHSATPRFPSPLIKPDVRISRIRLSDRLHCRLTTLAFGRMVSCCTPNVLKIWLQEKGRVPRPCSLCRLARKRLTRSQT